MRRCGSTAVSTIGAACQENHTRSLLDRSKEKIGSVVGVLIIHCTLIAAKDDAYCPKCGEDEEISCHYLNICKVFHYIRLYSFGTETLRPSKTSLEENQSVLSRSGWKRRRGKGKSGTVKKSLSWPLCLTLASLPYINTNTNACPRPDRQPYKSTQPYPKSTNEQNT